MLLRTLASCCALQAKGVLSLTLPNPNQFCTVKDLTHTPSLYRSSPSSSGWDNLMTWPHFSLSAVGLKARDLLTDRLVWWSLEHWQVTSYTTAFNWDSSRASGWSVVLWVDSWVSFTSQVSQPFSLEALSSNEAGVCLVYMMPLVKSSNPGWWNTGVTERRGCVRQKWNT